MANTVSRTFTKWHVKATKVFADRKSKEFREEEVGECDIISLNKPSRPEIVEEFAKKHIHIQKGTEFEFETVGYVTREMSVDTFVANSYIKNEQ